MKAFNLNHGEYFMGSNLLGFVLCAMVHWKMGRKCRDRESMYAGNKKIGLGTGRKCY